MIIQIGSFVMGFVWGMAITLIVCLLLFQSLEKARRKRKEKIAEHKALIERGFDPNECAEHHLRGDCPLCGAS